MPKIIDRDKYKRELATRAAPLFSEYGFSGLGMRAIAKHLGISKSALYHYFPTKKDLFHACTEIVTAFDDMELAAECNASEPAKRARMLINFVEENEAAFPQEMSLLFDYLRGRSREEIRDDATMQVSNKNFKKMVGQFVKEDETEAISCLLLGILLQDYLDGGQTDFKKIESWLSKVLT